MHVTMLLSQDLFVSLSPLATMCSVNPWTAFVFVFSARVEPRASCMQDKPSTTELHPISHE
jgi:hypothetical protein